jgi:hypothetical protein
MCTKIETIAWGMAAVCKIYIRVMVGTTCDQLAFFSKVDIPTGD